MGKHVYPAAQYSLTATSLYFTSIANGNSKMYSDKMMIDLAINAGFKFKRSFPLIGNSYHNVIKSMLTRSTTILG